MSPNPSETEGLLGSLRRALLGGLLGIIAIISIGITIRALPSGDYLVGVGSAALAVGAVSWIVHLFVTGYRSTG
jgi:predicted lipid-binding transport protein (Tim44 family)